jgi:hypothetical protein
MKKVNKGFIIPSAALALKPSQIKHYEFHDKQPEVGDVVYGSIGRIGQHVSIENVSGRIHTVHTGTRAIFVFGNRYAPDYYEGLLPTHITTEVDLLARSGMIGKVQTQNALVAAPTRVRILGYVCNENGEVLNTRQMPVINPRSEVKKTPRSPLILVVGTSMNAGKSLAAAACCCGININGL